MRGQNIRPPPPPLFWLPLLDPKGVDYAAAYACFSGRISQRWSDWPNHSLDDFFNWYATEICPWGRQSTGFVGFDFKEWQISRSQFPICCLDRKCSPPCSRSFCNIVISLDRNEQSSPVHSNGLGLVQVTFQSSHQTKYLWSLTLWNSSLVQILVWILSFLNLSRHLRSKDQFRGLWHLNGTWHVSFLLYVKTHMNLYTKPLYYISQWKLRSAYNGYSKTS